MSTPVHAPEILLCQFSVDTVLLLRNMPSKPIDLLADLTNRTFQLGEVSHHYTRLIHLLTSFGSSSFTAALMVQMGGFELCSCFLLYNVNTY
jgi:hypothetical protein